MRLGDPETRQPCNLATPDHATLAKHLYAVQHYTEIFDSATRRPEDSPNIQPYLSFICDSATWQPGDPRSCNISLSIYMQSNIILKYLTRRYGNPVTWGLAEQTTLLSLYMRLGNPENRRLGNLATPDHATLAKHLYAVKHYTKIFYSATRRPGDSPNIQPYLAFICDSATRQPVICGLAEQTTLLSLYMRLGDPAPRRPGNLATPDLSTLAKHLYAVQHYTIIFDSATRRPGDSPIYNLTSPLYATRRPGNPATWGLAEQTTLLSLYMRLGDPATRRPGDPR